MIETRLFHYFLAVARERNFTRAAESLHISQSTLSKQMMDLEEQLGKPLFIRGKRQIDLTQEGTFFKSRAEEVVNLVERTENAFVHANQLVAGHVYIGCSETPAMKHISQIFKTIREDYPDIVFHLYSGDASDILTKVEEGVLDMGLVLGPATEQQFDYEEIPIAHRFGMLMRRDHPLATKERLKVADLLGHDVILPQQLAESPSRLLWFGKVYEELSLAATYNLIYNAIFLAEENLGAVFCLKNMVFTNEFSNLTFREFEENPQTTLKLVTKKYQKSSNAVELVKDFLTDWDYESLEF